MRIEPLKLAPVTGKLVTDKPAITVDSDKSFSEFLSDAIGEVNKLQGESRDASLRLAAGKLQDISEVVIASEKASVALQLTMQVRNKVIDAYQEVMRMQV